MRCKLLAVANAVIVTEAIRTAQQEFGEEPLTGEQVRSGLEHLGITADRLKQLGLTDFMPPVSMSCEDHEGTRPVRIQQPDGEKWSFVSDCITPGLRAGGADARREGRPTA